jgi:hypothetical protein
MAKVFGISAKHPASPLSDTNEPYLKPSHEPLVHFSSSFESLSASQFTSLSLALISPPNNLSFPPQDKDTLNIVTMAAPRAVSANDAKILDMVFNPEGTMLPDKETELMLNSEPQRNAHSTTLRTSSLLFFSMEVLVF